VWDFGDKIWLVISENHIGNHVAWSRIVDIYSPFINFRGIIITGWQRYDHFAVLCELLPAGIPSLVASLQYIQTYTNNGSKYLPPAIILLKIKIFWWPWNN